MSEPLLTVKDLAVDFLIGGSIVNAVHDVSFSVDAGTALGIVGESGCGKTVTANAILQLLPKETSRISSGSIRFRGTELLGMSGSEICEVRGKQISMIFQDPMTSLNPVYTVATQLIEMVRAHRKISRKDAFELCVAMLEKVGIPSPRQRMKEYPHQLSGGMQQRVMIAMALICNPMLLIADEPTTALDVTIQAQILELMTKLQKELGTAIIIITHDIGVIAEISDQVMVMYAGEIVEHGPVAGIFDCPRHPYTQGLLRSVPKVSEQVETLYSIEGTVPSLHNMPEGCRFANRCADCHEKCRELPPLAVLQDGTRVRCWKYITDGEVAAGG